MSTLRFKCDQIGRITLCVVMDDKQTWVSNVVDNRIIQNVRLLPLFCWWHPHSTLSNSEFPSEDFTKVHSLVFLAIRSGIGVWCRVASINSKIHPLSICCGCKFRKSHSSNLSTYLYNHYLKAFYMKSVLYIDKWTYNLPY